MMTALFTRPSTPEDTQRKAGAADLGILAHQLIWALVDEPGKVLIETSIDDNVVTLAVDVDPTDMGKVIGKQGRTARSMRTILGGAAAKFKMRCVLDLKEGNPGGNR
jgi:hypothetical protein